MLLIMMGLSRPSWIDEVLKDLKLVFVPFEFHINDQGSRRNPARSCAQYLARVRSKVVRRGEQEGGDS